jgi:hypothetical protein
MDYNEEKICKCQEKGCPNRHSCDYCYEYTAELISDYGHERICIYCLFDDWLVDQESKDKVIKAVEEVFRDRQNGIRRDASRITDTLKRQLYRK